MTKRGFTLVELLVVATVIMVLMAVALPAIQSARASSWKVVSTHTLRNLIAAAHAYLSENNSTFWPYRVVLPIGTDWWFGREPAASRGKPEGERWLELDKSVLGPYIAAAGGWQTDPAFLAAGRRHKPKFKNASFGYAYNVLLGGGFNSEREPQKSIRFKKTSQLVVFITSAQVNTFQSPASPRNPMIEEFYGIDDGPNGRVVHFRHGGKALAAFLDGSVREMEMEPGTQDPRLPSAKIGRIAPSGSGRYLRAPDE